MGWGGGGQIQGGGGGRDIALSGPEATLGRDATPGRKTYGGPHFTLPPWGRSTWGKEKRTTYNRWLS